MASHGIDQRGSIPHAEQASRKHSQQEKATQGNEEESLTTILNVEQRTQLIVLLATATATMRDGILLTFDASATTSGSGSSSAEPTKEDEKSQNPNVNPDSADVKDHDREKRMIAAREKELSAPRMQKLKTEVLAWFDHWRGAMISRVGEVVKNKNDAKHVMQKQDAGGEHKATALDPEITDRKVHPEDGKGVNQDEDADKGDDMLKKLYPGIETPLAELDESKRILIMHAMLLILLSLESYAAPSRILLIHLVNSLRLPIEILDEDEKETAQGLLHATKGISGEAEAEQRAAANDNSKKWKIGLATVAGAAVVGLTGGLAAPLVAAGVGSVMGGLGLGATAAAGYLGSVAGSTLIVGGLFGAYGGRMTGKMMESYAKEVSDFAFIPVHAEEKHRHWLLRGKTDDESGKASASARRLRVTIGITGWLTEKDEVLSPWKVLGHQTECFALRFELESLMNLGNAIYAMVSSTAWGYVKKEVLARTIFADMMAALWPLGLLKLGRLVDNPFSIAKTRAEKAGAVLADALINRAQGERPVTLVGYSLGARVIYACLLSLAARREFGLIDTVVLIGSPIPSEGKDWRAMRSVVSGRLVNVFSRNDYILGFLYRTSSIQLGVAGLQKIEGVHGVENIDVSETVSGHLKYQYLIGAILHKIGFEDLDTAAIEKEEAIFKKMEAEEKARNEAMKKNVPTRIPGAGVHVDGETQSMGQTDAGSSNEGKDALSNAAFEDAADKEAAELEAKVHTKTQQSLMEKSMEYLSFGQKSQDGDGKSKSEVDVTESNTSPRTESASQARKPGKSYLEMATEGSANVGLTASNLFHGATSRLSWESSSKNTDKPSDVGQ